jgi:hypothetical protein
MDDPDAAMGVMGSSQSPWSSRLRGFLSPEFEWQLVRRIFQGKAEDIGGVND